MLAWSGRLICLVVDRRVHDSVTFDIAPIPARAVERQRQLAIAADRDEPAGAADPADIVDHRVRRLGQRLTTVSDPRRDLVRHAETDEEFAMTGRGHRAAGIVGVGPGAGDRAATDPTAPLSSH